MAALTANRQVDLLEQQAGSFTPPWRCCTTGTPPGSCACACRTRTSGWRRGRRPAAGWPQLPQADTVVTAVMGSVAWSPLWPPSAGKKRIALANKETLVCAGELVMAEAERCGADIVPVDSEHSAIFQSLQGCRDRNEVRRLLLTCSGGSFFGRSYQQLESVTPADALKHPNWSMGAKITIDSATLMNKAWRSSRPCGCTGCRWSRWTW